MKTTLLLLALAGPAFAATTYTLPGISESGSWDLNVTNFNNDTAPGYPASGGSNDNALDWGGPIAATGDSSATFTRISGAGYFIGSGSGIYGGPAAAGGSYAVADATPLGNLETVIFQVRLNLDPASVVLNLNGGSQAFAPAFTHVYPNDTANPDYAWQWDLRSFGDEITNYEILLSTTAHTVIYGNAPGLTTITAGNTFAQAIPEPSASMLGIAALTFLATRRRRPASPPVSHGSSGGSAL